MDLAWGDVPWGEEDLWSRVATPKPRHPVVQKQIWGYNNEGHLVPVWIMWDGCWLLDDPSNETLTLVQCHPGKKCKWNTEMLVEMLDTSKGVEEVMVPMDPKPPFVKTTLKHEDGEPTPAWVNFDRYWLCDEPEGREKKQLRAIWKRDLISLPQ